jgi:hypothetical protein
MRFMLIVFPGGRYPADPTEEDTAAMRRYTEELASAGVLLTVDGLRPPTEGARVRYASGKATVTDGPFAEAKEVVGGFWMLQVKSKAEAIEWARRAPCLDTDFVEVRQVYEPRGDQNP